MKEKNPYIIERRRKKARKRLIILGILFIIATICFLRYSPIFNLEKIIIEGTVTVSKSELEASVRDRLGTNIFILDRASIKDDILENKYISTVDIKQVGANKINIAIHEEAPIYFMDRGDNKLVLSNELRILEETSNLKGRTLVEVRGVIVEELELEENAEKKVMYSNILKAFAPYITENREKIRIKALDISNVVDIKGYIGDVEVYFGDITNLLEKMENVYRIMLNKESAIKSGYIDVSFQGNPIIKDTEVKEDEEKAENEENIEE